MFFNTLSPETFTVIPLELVSSAISPEVFLGSFKELQRVKELPAIYQEMFLELVH